MFVFSGEMCVTLTMQITFLTLKCPAVCFDLYVKRVSSLTLGSNGVLTRRPMVKNHFKFNKLLSPDQDPDPHHLRGRTEPGVYPFV